MRIQSLHLLAFGHFTNRVVDLSRGKEGLHLIYGPNESGKSSSLRALRQVLYGIPAKSTDNFKHAHPDMRIGVVLKHSDGSMLRLLRKKGNTKTLRKLDAENEIVDSALLNRYLGNINQTTFESMFGIDHQALVSGGEAILKGSGELGQLLFSAGAGIADLRSVLAGLEKEYQDLYTRGGTTRVINRQLAEYADAKKILRDSELPNTEWERHDQALRQAQARKQQLETSLLQNQKTLSKLRRYRDAIPLIAERSLYFNQLSELATTVLLPDSFEDQARTLLEQILILRNEETQDEAKRKQLSAELNDLNVPPGVIERTAAIEALQQKLGSHQKAALDKLSLDQSLIEEQERARACLRDLGRPDDFAAASNLRLSVQEKTRLRKLALERRALWQAYSDAQALRQRTEQRLKHCSEELGKIAKLPACEKLVISHKRIQQDPQMEERVSAENHRLERQFKQIQMDLKKLQLKGIEDGIELAQASKLYDDLHAIVLPEMQAVESSEKELTQLNKEIDALKARISDLTNELREIEYRLQEHDLKIAAPTESDLQEIRKQRDAGWHLVLKSWKDKPLEGTVDAENLQTQVSEYLNTTNNSDLSAAYENSLSKSDTVADRLRHEADHVAQKIQLTAQLQKLRSHVSDAQTKLQEREQRLARLRESWHELWAPLTERQLNPSSARIFIAHFETTCNSLSALIESIESAKYNAGLVARSKTELEEALKEAGWTPPSEGSSQLLLLYLLDQAQQYIDQYRAIKQSQADLEKEIQRLQGDLTNNAGTEQTRKAEIDSWAASWQPAVEGLGLSATTSPEELTAFLDRQEQFFSHYDQIQNLKRRVAGIERDASQFSSDVKDAINSLSESFSSASINSSLLNSKRIIELASAPVEQAAHELFDILKKTKELAQRKLLLKERLDEIIENTDARAASLCTLSNKLTQMINEASVSNEADLLLAAKNSQQKRRLSEQVDSYNRQIVRLAEGVPLEQFIATCNEHTIDELSSSISSIDEDNRLMETEKEELQIAIGQEKQALQGMDGSANAAEAAVKLQQVLSELGQDVEQYARLKIASVILKNAIERYREKNQSPILKKASDIFARLSNNNFAGLQEDFNERGEPVLFGVRAETSSLVPIEGMSEGTCDQVYLALRLAGLYLYLEKEEPLPFIVDDILVNFDDQRSLATLRVLAELSKKTQIIMFTHHSHIVDLVKEHLDPELVFINGLADQTDTQSLAAPQQAISTAI